MANFLQGSISETTVRKFCREASNLRLIRQSGSIADEYTGKLTIHQSELAQMLEQDPDSEATYYLILRGVDRFYSEFSALPGKREIGLVQKLKIQSILILD